MAYDTILEDWEVEITMPVEEFKEQVQCGFFIDYDGYGHPVKDGLSDGTIYLKPSQIFGHPPTLPHDATHVVWYNK